MSYREHTILYKELGSLLTRFSAKFEKQALRSSAISLTSKLLGLSFSRQLILEIERSNFRRKDSRFFHISSGLPNSHLVYFQNKLFPFY